MRIGIDVRYLSHGLVGGVHTYVAHFIPPLIELATKHHIVLYADTKRPFELPDLPPHVTVQYLPWRNPLSTIYHDAFMHRQMAHDHLDVVHFPANYGFASANTPTVITLHDAINVLPLHEIVRGHAKTPRTIAMMTYLHGCTKMALRRADMLLTVSAHARDAIAQQTNFDPDRIVPIHHAPTPDLQRVTDEAMLADVRNRYGLKPSFVLADGLKNPATLIRAWRRLPEELRKNREMVFFARRDPLPIVHEAVAAGDARLLLSPPRSDLIALYSIAEAFVFPSWIEGFGIPILEAMACGAPVIASNRGAIPEVAGGAALLADAEDDAMVAHHLAVVLGNPDQAARLRERGFARAAEFSWRATARQILDVYEMAAAAALVTSPSYARLRQG